MDEAGKVDGTPIVASSEAPEMLEAAEASFDLISLLVEGFVVGDEDLSVPLGGDHRLGFHAGDYLTQVGAIIRFISKHGIGLLSSRRAGAAVMSCTWPAVTWKRSGLPSASASIWILVVSPPRERPSA